MLVELEEVVRGRDQPPFGAGGSAPAAEEAGEAAVVLGVAEDRLDQCPGVGVELAAVVGREHARA